jgi:CBS domain containing-hemolysin-like protein
MSDAYPRLSSIPLACKYGRFNIADSGLDSILGEIHIKSLVIEMPRTETSDRGLAKN